MDGSNGYERRASDAALEELIAKIERLDDGGRAVVAAERGRVAEALHARALEAALSVLPERAEMYVRARARVSRAHLPARLHDHTDPPIGEEARQANQVARLVQQAVDEAVIALVMRDVLHPNHVRELYRSFAALDRARSAGS